MTELQDFLDWQFEMGRTVGQKEASNVYGENLDRLGADRDSWRKTSRFHLARADMAERGLTTKLYLHMLLLGLVCLCLGIGIGAAL